MQGYYKLNSNGTIQSRSKQVDDTWLPLSRLETKEEGSYYTYYNQDGTPDLAREQELIDAKALEEVSTECEEQVRALTEGIPEFEKLAWVKQEQEARAYLLDNTVATPLLDGIVTNRGIDKDYLISKVIEKADTYAVAVGNLIGLRQKAEDSLTQTSGSQLT